MTFVTAFLIPGLYFLFVTFMAFKKRREEKSKIYVFSVLCFLISMGLGTLFIFNSRGSTSGVGFLFLPCCSLVPALLGALLGYLVIHDKKCVYKVIPVALLILYFSYLIFKIVEVKQRNHKADISYANQRAEFSKGRAWVSKVEQENPDQASALFDKKIRTTKKKSILLAIARSQFLSTESLIELSRSKDIGVVLEVISNPNTPVSVLETVYRQSQYPSYFYTSLARNPRTPKVILEDLYSKREVNSGIEPGLAGNSKLPEEMALKILTSNNPIVLVRLGSNKSLDCSIVNKVWSKLSTFDRGNMKHNMKWAVKLTQKRLNECTLKEAQRKK